MLNCHEKMKSSYRRVCLLLFFLAIIFAGYDVIFFSRRLKIDSSNSLFETNLLDNSLHIKTDYTRENLLFLADTGIAKMKKLKIRPYNLIDIEALYQREPESKSEMKKRVSRAVFLSSKIDLGKYDSLHYVDLGARTYSSSILWFENNYPKFKGRFDVTAFEADPMFSSEYKRLQHVSFYNLAVWISNETLSFGGKMGRVQTDKDSCKYKCEKTQNKYNVRGINFSEFLLNRFKPSDFVIVKMDIEGAEYSVIPHMLETGAFNLIDEFFLEGHTSKLSKLKEVKQRKYDQVINMLSVIRGLGVWAHEWF